MSAPNFDALYKFEDFIESAARQILADNRITAFVARQDDVAVTPRVDIELQVGAATEHYGVRASDGQVFLDRWAGSLIFQIVTDRVRNDGEHATLRARLRYLMQQLSLWSETLLPYHQIIRIIEAGTSPEVRVEQDQDISTITFSVVFGIRADAWPATP